MQYSCPIDRSVLSSKGSCLWCDTCSKEFPIVNGVPILINDKNSVFQISDYLGAGAYDGASGYGGSLDASGGLKKAYRKFTRGLAEAPIPGVNLDPVAMVRSLAPDAKILVVGAGERTTEKDVTYTDVALAAGVSCVCDAHDLPFPDHTFGAVVASAVLEHVCDPQRCVSEFVRVLRPGGIVFAVTPFLQPVHMGAYDFTRFTHLGHRRLFRHFDEIESGSCGGSVYSAIHLMREAIPNLARGGALRKALKLLALLATHPLRHLDPVAARSKAAYGAACAFYFLGRLRPAPIPDREIIGMFREGPSA